MSQFDVSFLKNLYVDDSINDGDKETEVLNFYENASKVMLEAGFELRKQQSNSKVVCDYISSDNSMPQHELNVKVLVALSWLLENDKFVLDVSSYLKNTENVIHTKRNILKFITGVFDPAGLISPASINLKILLQQLRVLKVNWDDLIPTNLALDWKNLLTGLLSPQPFRFNRCYFYNNSIAQ